MKTIPVLVVLVLLVHSAAVAHGNPDNFLVETTRTPILKQLIVQIEQWSSNLECMQADTYMYGYFHYMTEGINIIGKCGGIKPLGKWKWPLEGQYDKSDI